MDEEKICPLSFHTIMGTDGSPMLLNHNCFKKGCAWWIEECGVCGVRAIAMIAPCAPFTGKLQGGLNE